MVVLGTTRLSEYLLEVVSAGSTSLISRVRVRVRYMSLFRVGVRVRVRVRVLD